jgi:hypothetical protein
MHTADQENTPQGGAHTVTDRAWTAPLVLEHLRELIYANDKRYHDAFGTSEKAVITAFIANEKATAAAFFASEKAIRDALAAVEKSTTAAFVAAEKAVALAEANAERWRADAAEWRARMTDREKNFAVIGELNALKERVDRNEGNNRGQKDMAGWIAAGVMLIISIATFFAHR